MGFMRNTVLAAALAVALPGFAGNTNQPVATAKATQKQAERYSIEQFMQTTNFRGASFSKDEKRILFSSNASGVFNVYTMPVAGGVPQQLTNSATEAHFAVGFFRNDDRILYTHDEGGNENTHLYVRELDGTERDLTPGKKVKARFMGWQADGNAFFVSTNEREPRTFDVYRYEANGYSRTLLYKNESDLSLATVSRDGKWLALHKVRTGTDTDIYVVNLATGEMKLATPHNTPATHEASEFDPESKRLLFTTDGDGEFSVLKAYDLASGAITDVEKAGWDMYGTTYSPDGRYRLSAVNEDGSVVMRLYDHGKPVALPNLQGGQMFGTVFSGSGKLMAYYLNGDRSPSNLMVYDLRTRHAKQLTQSLPKAIDPANLVDAEVVRFQSFDGTVIPSILYKPKGASSTSKVPALVYVHGGPGGQSKRGYDPTLQYLVNHGYAVLAINHRGSSGYGKSFQAADDRKHGREPLWDCVEAKTWLASQGYVDPQRIGIMGASYGGYMTLAALAFRPEAFKVGVDLWGPSNWVRTLESMPPTMEAVRKALYAEIGDPAAEKDMLAAISPLFHAEQIRKPLMVIQGGNDPRVPKAESEEIVAAVRKNNVPVDYLLFADEGHGNFRKKSNQAEATEKILAFLDKHLKQGN